MFSHAPLNHAFTLTRKFAFARHAIIPPMTYGGRLQQAMTLAKKVRRDLATALGVSVQAIGQVVTSPTSQLTAENSAKAARYLGVDHHWLATGEGEPRPWVKPVASPMALDLARQFDTRTPPQLRDRVYSQVTGAIELAATVHQQSASQPAGAPTESPPQH